MKNFLFSTILLILSINLHASSSGNISFPSFIITLSDSVWVGDEQVNLLTNAIDRSYIPDMINEKYRCLCTSTYPDWKSKVTCLKTVLRNPSYNIVMNRSQAFAMAEDLCFISSDPYSCISRSLPFFSPQFRNKIKQCFRPYDTLFLQNCLHTLE